MFAIRISEESLPKINESRDLSPLDATAMKIYLRSRVRWYFIRGYVTERGTLIENVAFPEYHLKKNYEIDFERAETDWDQIVRK